MQVSPLERRIQPSELPPERLAGNSHLTEAQKIAELSRQFEAILLRQILQDAQKPVIQSTQVKDSTAASIYRDMTTQQLADSISKSGSFGLAKTLNTQLSAQMHPRAKHPMPKATQTTTSTSSPAPISATSTAAQKPARRWLHFNARHHE